MDPSDLPLDGNPCTFDECDGDKPFNPALPDKSPCPGEDSGICVLGQCKDCSEVLDVQTCSSGFECDKDQCVPLTCKNNLKEDPETDTDCGGPACRVCKEDLSCLEPSDCLSNVCTANICQKSTHADGQKNDTETGVDCGHPGGLSNMCADGEGCGASNDCKSGVCYLGICQAPTCVDATQNGEETGVDCGGPAPCSPCTK
jgi:hypothetical protein